MSKLMSNRNENTIANKILLQVNIRLNSDKINKHWSKF